MSQRFFVEPPITGQQATLAGSEAQHLAKVMRARVGDEVMLFDGSGSEFVARVESIGRHEVELVIVRQEIVDRESKHRVTLGVALPKGERQAWLVEKAVELGVAAMTPLITERGVAQPNEATLSRLRRNVIEASKQCGRNRLMEVNTPEPLEQFVQHTASLRWLAHPGSESQPPSATWHDGLVAIGPEGGFTDHEVKAASDAGWQIVGLGPRILRVETAALALAARLTQ